MAASGRGGPDAPPPLVPGCRRQCDRSRGTAARPPRAATSRSPGRPAPRPTRSARHRAPTPAPGEGDWLLGMSSAGGADGETTTTVYITLQPLDRCRPPREKLPGRPGRQRRGRPRPPCWSAPTGRGPSRTPGSPGPRSKSGQLKVYSLVRRIGEDARPPRSCTGQKDVTAVGWAFDPKRAGHAARRRTTENRVWAVERRGRQGHRGGRRSPRGRGSSPTASTPTPASPGWRASRATRPTRPATAWPTPAR